MRVLITGGKGQLATDLASAFEGHHVAAPGHDELDVTNVELVREALEVFRADVVVNTAAFHRVDLCESEPEQSFLVNAAAPQRLAAACSSRGATLVQISTDYVFDGCKGSPYAEEDPVNPLSVYGASRVAGEMAVRCTTERHLIVRTTGLYGLAGRSTRQGNFVETMLRLARERKRISVVSDQVLTPSYTADVAEVIVQLVERGAEGTFHVTNSGRCSWYEFAAEVFRLAGVEADLIPVTQAERPVPARRPAFSVLAHNGIARLGIPELRPWQEALAQYLSSRPPH